MDTKRIQELAGIVESMWCNGSVHEPTARSVKEALDEFARIKGAAVSVPEIEARVTASRPVVPASAFSQNALAIEVTQLHKDCIVLLDALRVREAETQVIIDRLDFVAKDAQARAETMRQRAADSVIDIARYRNFYEQSEREANTLRAQLAQAQKFAEMEHDRAERANDFLEHATEKLAQAERDKAALREGLRLAMALAETAECDTAHRPALASLEAWKGEHGALVPREGEAQRDAKPENITQRPRLEINTNMDVYRVLPPEKPEAT